MPRKYLFFVIAVLLTVTSHAYAKEEKKTSVEEFRSMTESQVERCRIIARGAFALAEMGEMSGRPRTHQETISFISHCLVEGKAEVKKLFLRANTQIARKSTVSKFLKEYYAVWLTAFEGISPDKNEIIIGPDKMLMLAYDRRQNDASRKVTEAWHRFEIEASL